MEIIIFDIAAFLSKKYSNNTLKFEYIMYKNKYIYIRPGTEEFLNECMKKHDIAFWNFKTKKNCKKIMALFLNRFNIKPKFIWYRNSTELVIDKEGNLHNKTIKNINRVILSPSINKKFIYNKLNVRIMDNILHKFDPSIDDKNYHENIIKISQDLLI